MWTKLTKFPLGLRNNECSWGIFIVRDQAQNRNLEVFDATCPLVTKVHAEVKKLAASGFEIIMIGHQGHPEVEGTMGKRNLASY